MERHDVSFSLPTWTRQQIRSLTMLQQQNLYAKCPFNLNDFKNDNPNVDFIFKSEQQSKLKDYSYKREFNNNLQTEIAVFVQFLLEVILHDNDIQKNKQRLIVNVFKQYVYKADLCKFTMIPQQWRKYYKNQIIKKIIFQYISKCVYNLSLVELLLQSNNFLRFCIVLLIKSILIQQKIISNYYQNLSFKKMISYVVDWFDVFFHQNLSQLKELSTYFNSESQSIRSMNYFLTEQQQKLYLYRKEIIVAKKLSNLPKPIQNHGKSDKTNEKAKRTTLYSQQQKNKQKMFNNKKMANFNGRNAVIRQRQFWDCLPCFCFKK